MFGIGSFDILSLELYKLLQSMPLDDSVVSGVYDWQHIEAFLPAAVAKEAIFLLPEPWLKLGVLRMRMACLEEGLIRLRFYVDLDVKVDMCGKAVKMLQFMEMIDTLHDRFFTNCVLKEERISLLINNGKNKNLLDIYLHIESPHCYRPEFLGDTLFNEIAERQCPTGMRTNLYAYQKHSLRKMLIRERNPEFLISPECLCLHSIDGHDFYFDTTNGMFSKDPKLIPDVAGGILCEDMGTGKTCLCLALVLYTKNQLPNIENITLETDLIPSTLWQKCLCKLITSQTNLNFSTLLPSHLLSVINSHPLFYTIHHIPSTNSRDFSVPSNQKIYVLSSSFQIISFSNGVMKSTNISFPTPSASNSSTPPKHQSLPQKKLPNWIYF